MRNKTKVDIGVFIFAFIASFSIFYIQNDYGGVIASVSLIIVFILSWYRRDIYDLLRNKSK